MLGAIEDLSAVLRTAYSQENNTAGQGLDEDAGEVRYNTPSMQDENELDVV